MIDVEADASRTTLADVPGYVEAVCTVMLRLDPDGQWPVLLAAVRDEFVQRAWDAPDAHWPEQPTVIGGRDRVAGGTWMAVDTATPAVAALLNGVRLPDLEDGPRRPTRGSLVLDALWTAEFDLDAADVSGYDGFHLLRADIIGATVWSWDGVRLTTQYLDAGDHIIVNLGVDRDADPLVPYFRPKLAAMRMPHLDGDSATAWADWIDLLRGDGLDLDDPRGLIIEHERAGLHYGSTSASLVGLTDAGDLRYEFTATPQAPAWGQVWPMGSMSV